MTRHLIRLAIAAMAIGAAALSARGEDIPGHVPEPAREAPAAETGPADGSSRTIEFGGGGRTGLVYYEALDSYGHGAYAALRFNPDRDWYLHARFADLRYRGEHKTKCDGFLWIPSATRRIRDTLRIRDVVGGIGRRFEPAGKVTVNVGVGGGYRSYRAKRTEKDTENGVLTRYRKRKAEGGTWIVDYEVRSGYAVADWLDLEFGAFMDVSPLDGYRGGTRWAVSMGLEAGLVVAF